jgi:hypothetical protein
MRERRSVRIGGPLEPRPSIGPESSDNYKMLAPDPQAGSKPSSGKTFIRDKSQTIKVRLVDMPAAHWKTGFRRPL